MTPEAAAKKLSDIYTEWYNEVRTLSLKELKDHIKNAPKRQVLYELELNHRLNGGVHPIHIIADKMAQENNYKKISIDASINFMIYK